MHIKMFEDDVHCNVHTTYKEFEIIQNKCSLFQNNLIINSAGSFYRVILLTSTECCYNVHRDIQAIPEVNSMHISH